MASSGPGMSVPLAILLPTLNEEEGLAATVQDLPLVDLRALGFEPTVLVVDGHSTDGTVQVARSAGATLITQQGKGKGAAVREGMDWAVARGIPYLVVLDADFTYPGSALPAMATLLDAGSDMVIGVRRPDRHAMSELRGLVHRLGNAGLNFLAGYLSRGPILDVCSGLWGIRTSILAEMHLVSEGFDIEAEAFVKAFRTGFAVSQLPVTYRDRLGTAKLHAFGDGSRILFSILRYSGRSAARAARSEAGTPVSPDILPRTTLRDLQSVLFALNNQRVFVSAASGGGPLVDELVHRLSGTTPSLTVEKVRGESEIGGRSELPPPTASSFIAPGGKPWTIIIDLPSGPLRGARQAATIRVPSGQRKIFVDLSAPYEFDPVVMEGAARSRAYKMERSSDRGPLSSLRILSSSLAQFGEQRDLALIAANVAHSDYTVFRGRSRKGLSDSSGVGSGRTVSGSMDGTGKTRFE